MNALGTIIVALLIVAAALGSFVAKTMRVLSRHRLDEACRRRGHPERFAVILKRTTETFLATELVAIAAITLLAAVAGIRFVAEFRDAQSAHGRLSLLAEPLILVTGFALAFSLIPWTLARVAGERFVARCWPALEVLNRLLSPYLGLARRIDAFMHRLSGLKEPGGDKSETLAGEIMSVVELGFREGILAAQARRIIERVIALQQEDVGAVMTPRTEMDCILADVSLEAARQLMVEGGHSRMPVIGASPDDVVGIIYAKDLLRHLSPDNDGHELRLRDIVREPFYVPETTGVDKLLESMKRRGVHIAIVLDEYGGVAGLVTMEDVLEEVVGEIVDEYDTAEDTGIRTVTPGSLEVASWVRLDDLREQFGFDLPDDEDYDTIGGFIYAHLGRIPKKRETFTWKQLRVTVIEADKRRIRKIRLDSLAPQAVPAGEPTT